MRSQRGFSLGEILISVALLGIVATMSTQMIVGTFNSIGRQENKGQCTHVAQSLISMIDRIGTRDRVLAPVVPGVNFQVGSESSVLNAQVQPSEQFLLPVWFPYGSTLPLVTMQNGFIRVNNAQLIVSSINLVQNFYNQNPSSCTSREGTSIIEQLRLSQTPLPPNTLDIRLKINPYDLTSQGTVGGITCPTPPLLVSPQRFDKKVVVASQGQSNDQTTEGFIWGGDSSIGFNVSVNVTMRGADRNETCTFQKSFYHDRDQANPTVVGTPDVPTSADGVGLWTQMGPSQFIGPGMNSIELPIHFSSLEKGSVVLCGDPVSDGTRLKDCASVELTPVGGGTTRRPASVRWDNNAVATFQFTGLPTNKTYKLAMAAIDTSGNRTPQFEAQFEARPCTGEVINPASCPLEVDCPLSVDPSYPSNARISCIGTTAAAISRYGAVISALKYRNQPVCIETPNFFTDDGTCVGGPPDDPKLCQDLGAGITRQKCLDATANNPFLTVGTVYRQTFNHHQVTLDEATVFAYRASIQAICGEQIMRDIMSNSDGQKLAREAFVAARAYPVDSILPPPPIPKTSNFWGHIYIALKLGALSDVEAGRAFEGAPGGHLNVSSARMNQLMTSFSASLTGAGSCAALRTAVINP